VVVPQPNAFVADSAPPAARGRFLALYHATWSLRLLIAPPGILPLHERLGETRFERVFSTLLSPGRLLKKT
jgi:hypothetical protein